MENKNIIYIDYLNSYTEVTKRKKPKWISWLIYKTYNYLGIIKKQHNFFTLIAEKNDIINERMLKNLYNTLYELDINTVVCADLLLKNEEFVKKLEENNFKILKGKWIFKFLAHEILDKLVYIKNMKKSNLEVSILVNNPTELSNQNAIEFAKECKILNIITNNISSFEKIEKKLIDDYGIIVNISSNMEKSCSRSDIVFNFDFKENELKKCKMKKEAVLVQINQEKFIRNRGITIRFVKLKYNKQYDDFFKLHKHFDEEILYESCLYYKTSYDNIRKILKRDNIHIRYFIGNNGKIEFNEFRM